MKERENPTPPQAPKWNALPNPEISMPQLILDRNADEPPIIGITESSDS